MRKIAFINQKGGVGKTTSSLHVAAALARSGRRTLLIEANDSMNATQILKAGEHPQTLHDVLLEDVSPQDAIVETSQEDLYFMPTEAKFANFISRAREINEAVPQLVMRQKLKGIRGFDYVVLDSPPTLDLATINVLAYVDECYVPVKASSLSLQGLHRIQAIIEGLRENFDQISTRLNGIFLTLVNPRTLATHQIRRYLDQNFPGLVFRSVIPFSVEMEYALGRHQTMFQYNPTHPISEQYIALTKEILAYEQQRSQQRIR